MFRFDFSNHLLSYQHISFIGKRENHEQKRQKKIKKSLCFLNLKKFDKIESSH
jgi:hypothetical protein